MHPGIFNKTWADEWTALSFWADWCWQTIDHLWGRGLKFSSTLQRQGCPLNTTLWWTFSLCLGSILCVYWVAVLQFTACLCCTYEDMLMNSVGLSLTSLRENGWGKPSANLHAHPANIHIPVQHLYHVSAFHAHLPFLTSLLLLHDCFITVASLFLPSLPNQGHAWCWSRS